MSHASRTAAYTVLSLIVTAGSVFGQGATLEPLGFLDDAWPGSTGDGISDDGNVVIGNSTNGGDRRAFRWTEADGMVDLGSFTDESLASGVSGDGSVVVGNSHVGVNFEAFRWDASTGLESLGLFPDGNTSAAFGASRDGRVICGFSSIGDGRHAFRWTKNTGLQDLGTLGDFDGRSLAKSTSADGAVIVGTSESPDGVRAYRWTSAGGMQDLGSLSGDDMDVGAVSADGSVVVGVDFGLGGVAAGWAAYRWTQADGMTALRTLDDAVGASTPFDLSDDGRTIVGKSRGEFGDEACIWIDGVPKSLSRILERDLDADVTGWTSLIEVHACSADGLTLAGWGIYEGDQMAFRVRLNHAPSATGPTTQTVECEGDRNLVGLSSVVGDPDDFQRLTVVWKVDGDVKKTSENVRPGTTVAFNYDYPDGASSVVVEVTDGYKTARKGATVSVVDTTAPTISVAADVTVPTDPGKDFATAVDLGDPGVFDLCDGDPELSNDAPNRFKVGTTTVKWTAIDADGNRSTATQKVRVEDREPPKIGAVANVTVEIGGNATTASVDLPTPSVTDNVDDDVSLVVEGPSTFPIGLTSVSWTATDDAGNSSTKTGTVKIVRSGEEVRPNGVIADYFCEHATAYAYDGLSTSYNGDILYAYYCAFYAWAYGASAGDRIVWDEETSRDEAFAEYAELRGYQEMFAEYAIGYSSAAYLSTGDANALYAYIFALYGEAYANVESGD